MMKQLTLALLSLVLGYHSNLQAQNPSPPLLTRPQIVETQVPLNVPVYSGSGMSTGTFGQTTQLQGKGVIVIVPKTGKRVWGFSVTTGKWASIDLEEGDVSEVNAAIGNGLAGFRVKRWLYGFSEKAGRWDKIQISANPIILNPGEFGPQPLVSNYSMATQYRNTACAFSSEHAKWDRVTLNQGLLAQVAVGNSFVTLTDGESYYYAFSDASQEWGGVNLMTGEPLPINRELPQ